MTIERLSWASGSVVREGWHHSDERWYEGMQVLFPGFSAPLAVRDHVGRIQEGLPWEDGSMDYVVSHHGLMMLPEGALIPALAELRRVTKPGGWLRVSVPDMKGAMGAWRRGDRNWFPLEADDIDTAFCLYVTQGGATRSVFTRRRLRRLLTEAGWMADSSSPFLPSPYQVTYSPHPGITELDSRPNESLFMEAVNPA